MKSAQEIVNESGYPLQLHLEKLITSSIETQNWKILAKEHRWVNADTKEEGFIDLILERERYLLKLVIECKRILGNWIFLVPKNQFMSTREVRILYTDYGTSNFLWTTKSLYPESHESQYCVLETGGKKDSRTLENIAGESLLSLEYLAIQEADLLKPIVDNIGLPNQSMFYLPIIVTTANLQSMVFDRTTVNIENGQVTDGEVTPIDYIRFRKNLATNIEYNNPGKIFTLDQLNQENDRSVFIVQAKSFIRFISMLNFL
jgi:hypothetical protein